MSPILKALAPPEYIIGRWNEDQIPYIDHPQLFHDYWVKVVTTVMLVLLGGLFAGLTLGLMSLDETNLHILASSGDQKQRKYARRIQPIRKNGHLLLVTLLLSNVLVNETLPIVMDDILGGGGTTAILVSSALIVIFGEIIPQAVCSRYGLAIGAFFAWPVRILIWLTFIVGYPIAKLLDLILGQDRGIIYRRAELKELIMYHETTTEHGGDLVTDSVKIIRGTLDLQDKVVESAMTPIEKAFMISNDSIMDRDTMGRVYSTGHSRIPVYEGSRENILGVLLVKSLVTYNPDEALPLKKFRINNIPKVAAETPLFDILNIFREGRSHMAIVNKGKDSKPIGIITLEDVLEELIQEEIYDESDKQIRLLTEDQSRPNNNYNHRRRNKFKSPPLMRFNSEPTNVMQPGEDHIIGGETEALLSFSVVNAESSMSVCSDEG
ncbi:7630_t:CDS:2 [Acaulospora morrowiae]|uniref:7630_t:CDS:1 n=1 Tax=Acaulospora morrowiae TaxID=94023 RepID=A0A9N9BMN9_9GLOM|nr:7630_t:CDS:2 [Acaulospora morrowiae]